MDAGAARPFPVGAPWIRALLDGRKTQDRQVIRSIPCPFGKPGDLLWVKESCWQDRRDTRVVVYEATAEYYRDANGVIRHEPDDGRLDALRGHGFWSRVSTLYMPRWASRLTLEITEIRVGRFQEISEADAKAEGFAGAADYRRYWEGRRPWEQNPWVWILAFIVHQRNVTAMEASAERDRRKNKTGLLFSYGPVYRQRR